MTDFGEIMSPNRIPIILKVYEYYNITVLFNIFTKLR